MSSWTSLRLDGYEVWSSHSYAGHDEVSLFQDGDKHLRLRVLVPEGEMLSPWLDIPEVDALPWRRAEGRFLLPLAAMIDWERPPREDYADDDSDFHESEADSIGPAAQPDATNSVVVEAELDLEHRFAGHGYITTVARARDRLEAMGFTLGAAKRVFDEFVEQERARAAELDMAHPSMREIYRQQLALMSSTTFERWLESFRWLKERGAHTVDRLAESCDPRLQGYFVHPDEATPLVEWLLDQNGDHRFGFPFEADTRHLFRAALEVCDSDADVVLDLTAVTQAGYYGELDAVVETTRTNRLADYPADARIIVLTEGPTDRRALEGALRVLYPHLVDLYSFMDFEGMRIAGGAGPLVEMVKTFSGAGIANRIVAFFDNDTAAHGALRSLRTMALPRNIRVLTYPRIPLAQRYPTVGPVGEQFADIDGSAASIELYFGEDVLRDPTGALMPVRWGAMDRGVGRYQGELMDKRVLQDRFEEKLRHAEADPAIIAAQDWSGMMLILSALRQAFQDLGSAPPQPA